MTEYIVSVFGVRIRADSEEEIDHIEENIEYLTEFTGIGHVRAAELLKAFEKDLDRVLDAESETLQEVPGIGPNTAEDLSERITDADKRIEKAREEHSPTFDELDKSDPFDMVYAGE